MDAKFHPAMAAIKAGDLDELKSLLKKDPTLATTRSSAQNAALHGHRAMVEFLIEQGADANVKDHEGGGTPAGWAEYGGHVELKDYLEQAAKTDDSGA